MSTESGGCTKITPNDSVLEATKCTKNLNVHIESILKVSANTHLKTVNEYIPRYSVFLFSNPSVSFFISNRNSTNVNRLPTRI